MQHNTGSSYGTSALPGSTQELVNLLVPVDLCTHQIYEGSKNHEADTSVMPCPKQLMTNKQSNKLETNIMKINIK